MANWISVKKKMPDMFSAVWVKTNCKDCPYLPAIYQKRFVLSILLQCEKHYLKEADFKYIGMATREEIENYLDRITHWKYREETDA